MYYKPLNFVHFAFCILSFLSSYWANIETSSLVGTGLGLEVIMIMQNLFVIADVFEMQKMNIAQALHGNVYSVYG